MSAVGGKTRRAPFAGVSPRPRGSSGIGRPRAVSRSATRKDKPATSPAGVLPNASFGTGTANANGGSNALGLSRSWNSSKNLPGGGLLAAADPVLPVKKGQVLL
ncbi:hypothetical protein DIPPA_17001 [Diplonema papillatum]|nr:hypothetical protein DIPPA_17001 [Diplonema papillatum]